MALCSMVAPYHIHNPPVDYGCFSEGILLLQEFLKGYYVMFYSFSEGWEGKYLKFFFLGVSWKICFIQREKPNI